MLPIRLATKTHPQFTTTVAAGVTIEPGKRQQGETAGDELKTEQHDDHETHRKDDRADERLSGRECASECEACGDAENGAGQDAANEKIGGRERELAPSCLDHRCRNFRRFHVVHTSSPWVSVRWNLQT